jgi:hypothetical protein
VTFASEMVRTLFHQLPTETQVMYSDWEAKLARKKCLIHVDAVMLAGTISEVVVRITENFNTAPAYTEKPRSY